jgi:hypothetical protein
VEQLHLQAKKQTAFLILVQAAFLKAVRVGLLQKIIAEKQLIAVLAVAQGQTVKVVMAVCLHSS